MAILFLAQQVFQPDIGWLELGQLPVLEEDLETKNRE
ncbi:hypothetical protein HNQ81_002394 [Desulfoprunum benzoelyticum]|uniref:Uncharacterized protein n=1 Tax=Desulfoprunum benzoelyticum TaxID=1506996 RepID=A0A840UYX6_9BACT|nr:hypothetical protein [Desulfoprunum benzoelyticum]